MIRYFFFAILLLFPFLMTAAEQPDQTRIKVAIVKNDSEGPRVFSPISFRPDLLLPQTGLMQGAAGIGLWFLRLDNHKMGRSRQIILPDDPF